MADLDVTASLSGESTLVSLGPSALFALVVSLSGSSEVLALESWRPTPGAPSRMPTLNAAATLQQFIDALGVGRSVTKTTTANSTVVDPNPPRKPFTPR
jgi:hypothetical protein